MAAADFFTVEVYAGRLVQPPGLFTRTSRLTRSIGAVNGNYAVFPFAVGAGCFVDWGGFRFQAASTVKGFTDMARWIAQLMVLAGVATGVPAAEERFDLELELGPVWQSRNDVEIPNDGSATRFSLVDLAGNGPWLAARAYFTWNISRRHGLRLLAAPFSYTETGAFDAAVIFEDQVFQPDVVTQATYQFNSWRATYRYRFHDGKRWHWWIGFTAKVRDAKIELSQGSGSARDTDLGFVPLVYIRGEWAFADRWRFILDVDAIAGGPGRAEDLALKVGYDIGEHWGVTTGYRTVEGGADTDDVYTFAWFNYAVVSGVYRWGHREAGERSTR